MWKNRGKNICRNAAASMWLSLKFRFPSLATDWLPSPFSHAHSPTRHSLTPPPPLAFLVMRCRWAETRPHVSAGFAASSAPIISSLPWHRAQRQLTARHLTAASHAWTPDTVTAWPNQIRSLVSVCTIQSQMCVFTNRLTGKLPGRELASSPDHCLLCLFAACCCFELELVSHVFVCVVCFTQLSWLGWFIYLFIYFKALGVQLESSTDSPTLESVCKLIKKTKQKQKTCDCTCI